MFNRCKFTIAFMVLLLLAMGCVPGKQPLRFFERSQDRLLNEHLKKAHRYEHRADMLEALKKYELAYTINPSSQEALKGRQRVEKALHSAAKAHYEKGLGYQKKAEYGPARHQFLIALRLRPDYPEAVEILTSRKRIKTRKFIVHEIQDGETLSKLAKRYYGDYQKFPIIASFNDLKDATEIKIGQNVKVPEIEGAQFLVAKELILTEEQYVDDLGHRDWETSAQELRRQKLRAEIQGREKKKLAGQIALYRAYGKELFDSAKYPEAIVEFQNVLRIYPDDTEALDYCYRSNFQIAESLFEKKDYLLARERFKATLRYNNHCQECHNYIKKSENLYKDHHYKKGMQHYGDEQLVEAIEEWELVVALDPNYKKADYLINKAQTILKKLEEIKASEEVQASPD